MPIYARVPTKTSSCRGCGATSAPSHANEYGLCATCWTQVQYSIRNSKGKSVDAEKAVSLWMAAKLTRDIKRLKTGQPVHRCQAISNWREGRPGTQCGNRAIGYRDGRAVCTKHKSATAPVFVGDSQADYYEVLKGLIVGLAEIDSRFSEILREINAALALVRGGTKS